MKNILTQIFGTTTKVTNALTIKNPGSVFKYSRVKIINPQTGKSILNIKIK